MTHDEALAEHKNLLETINENFYYATLTYDGSPEAWEALRKIVERHKPIYNPNFLDSEPWCYQCADGRSYSNWPCLTIQDIKEEME